MTTTIPGNRALPQRGERAEIETRVANFRQHQAKLQAEREQRWARTIAQIKASLQAGRQ